MTPACDSPSPLRDDSSSAQAHAVTNTSVTYTLVTDVIPLHTHFCVMHTPVCVKDIIMLRAHFCYIYACYRHTCVTDTLVLQTHLC